MLQIISNGSKWAGQPPEPLEVLYQKLEQYTLNPIFEESGGFVNSTPHWR